MRKLFIFNLLSTLIIFSGCKKEPVDNSPIIVLTAEPNPVNFLGNTNLSWSCSNVSECTLNGQSVSLNSNLIISNIKSDTTFVISCKSDGAIISKSLTVKVGDKPLYMKYIDTLCTGKWVQTQERIYGFTLYGTKPNEWYIRNTPIGDLSDGVDYDDNSWSFVFSKDDKFSNLTYEKLEENYLMNGPTNYILSNNCKTFQLGSGKPWEILSISDDSLVLYDPSHMYAWAGSDGSGSGAFPTINKYEHFAGYNNIIRTNDPTSNAYKILTANYWRMISQTFYTDGVFRRTDSITDSGKNIKYYFKTDGIYVGYLEDKVVEGGANHWYLIDSNTKIRTTGSIPSRNYLIMNLDDNKLVLKYTQPPHPLDGGHIFSHEICYIRN